MRILVADDHALFREGLRSVFQRLDSHVVVIEAQTAGEALEKAGPELDLVLIDIYMPGLNVFPTIKALRQRYPSVPIAVISASEDPVDVANAMALNVAGYIPKSFSAEAILEALRTILNGDVYVPANLRSRAESLYDRGALQPGESLTERQTEVLKLVSQGLSNKEIASVLNLTEGTVKLHVTSILRALGAPNRTKAVLAATRLGLIEPNA